MAQAEGDADMAQMEPKDPHRRARKEQTIILVAVLLAMLFVAALWCEGVFERFRGENFERLAKLGVIGAWRLALAMLLGLVVGMERERRDKPAGIRTISMVCAGACLFVLIGTYTMPNADAMSRIMQGIITGIGFLGAGTIIKHEFNVEGLTTAATLWAAAGVGLACGLGQYVFAGLGTLAIWVVLKVFRKSNAHRPAANGNPPEPPANDD
jgi:putative Mg2+ transporter-C (MgtC) family protein